MKDTLKVAKWEIKRNLSSKTFIISLILTPILTAVFGLVPTLLTKIQTSSPVTLYVSDKLNLYEDLEALTDKNKITLVKSEKSPEELSDSIKGKKNEAFLVLDSNVLSSKNIDAYTGTNSTKSLEPVNTALQYVLKNHRLKELGIGSTEISGLNTPYTFNSTPLEGVRETGVQKYIPAIFAGILLLAVFITGTMTFYSSLQEKKDKMVEILLSSIKPEALMQGKIAGYFILGLIQIIVWMAFGIPAIQMYTKIPVAKYLFTPALIPMLIFALGGYLMYSAMFVAIGATMEDVQSATNFQGTIMMIPMLPLFILGPIIADPSGIVAMAGTYFPLTTPGVMLLRLSLSSGIPPAEIIISGIILIITIAAIVTLSGKLFKTAILMYDKTASAGEMFKWLKN